MEHLAQFFLSDFLKERPGVKFADIVGVSGQRKDQMGAALHEDVGFTSGPTSKRSI